MSVRQWNICVIISQKWKLMFTGHKTNSYGSLWEQHASLQHHETIAKVYLSNQECSVEAANIPDFTRIGAQRFLRNQILLTICEDQVQYYEMENTELETIFVKKNI